MSLPEYEDYNDYDDGDAYDAEATPGRIVYRGASSDPTFGYLIALALTVGLTALPPDQRDLRYTILWMIPAGRVRNKAKSE